jgi:site-specific DNA recombinase
MRLVEPVGLTEAGFIEDLFQRIAAGSSALKECHRLNALGVPTVRRYAGGTMVDSGATWRPSRINKLLHNTVYLGVHRLKSQRGVIERTVPALIDQALWDAVQTRLLANRCLPKNTVHRLYLLRSLITCGLCGARFIGTGVRRKSGHVTYYYRCSSQTPGYRAQLHERCRAKSLKALWLEDLIWQDCREFILNPGDALAEAKRQLETRRSQSPSMEQEQRGLQQALAEKAVERERVMTMFQRGRLTLDEAEARIDAVETEAAQLRTLLTGLQAQHEITETFAAHYAQTSTLLAALSADLEAVERSNDLARKRQVVELLVAGIRVDTQMMPHGKEAQVAITYSLTPKRAVQTPTPGHRHQRRRRTRIPIRTKMLAQEVP